MQNVTLQTLMNRSLLLGSLLTVWTFCMMSIDSKFDNFYLSLSSYVDHHAPIKKMNKKDLKLHSKPWITPKIYCLIKYHDKLLRKLNKKFSNSND